MFYLLEFIFLIMLTRIRAYVKYPRSTNAKHDHHDYTGQI